jgi:hypothetical protein
VFHLLEPPEVADLLNIYDSYASPASLTGAPWASRALRQFAG